MVVTSSTRAKVDAAAERLRGATGDLVDLKQEASIVDFPDRLEPFDYLVITGGDSDRRRFASTLQPLPTLSITLLYRHRRARTLGACRKRLLLMAAITTWLPGEQLPLRAAGYRP